MDSERHAVVLAAGIGRRLMPLTASTPKTLLDVADRPILGHILDALAATGYDDVTVVTGFEADQVREYCRSYDGDDLDFSFVHSDDYAETNNVYSLWLARDRLRDGFTLINSDTVFPTHALDRLADRDRSALVVDPGTALDDEEMKVRVDDDTVEAIGKDLHDPSGEYIGVCKFDAAGATAVVDALDAVVAAGRTDEWYEAAFDRVFPEVDVGVVAVGGDWIEIDDVDDLRAGRRLWDAPG